MKQFILWQVAWVPRDFQLPSSSSAWKRTHSCLVLCHLLISSLSCNEQSCSTGLYTPICFSFKISHYCILITYWEVLSRPSDVSRWSDLASYYKTRVGFFPFLSQVFQTPLPLQYRQPNAGSSALPFRCIFWALRILHINTDWWTCLASLTAKAWYTLHAKTDVSNVAFYLLSLKLITVRATREPVKLGLFLKFWIALPVTFRSNMTV